MNSAHMLLIGERSGVGKSTVAFALHDLLSARGVQHAVIEGPRALRKGQGRMFAFGCANPDVVIVAKAFADA